MHLNKIHIATFLAAITNNCYNVIAFTSVNIFGTSSKNVMKKSQPQLFMRLNQDNDDEHVNMNSRRAFVNQMTFATLLALNSATSFTLMPQVTFAEAEVDYKAVAADIASLVKEDPDKGPTLVRLAWHSSGTYDKMSKTGGSGEGTIRFKEELAHGGNAGLGSTAVPWLEPLKEKYGAGLSYADLYTLAGGGSF